MKVTRDATGPEPASSGVYDRFVTRDHLAAVDKSTSTDLSQILVMERTGIEPVTFGLQSRRSPS
jgi:hypothetical protein